LRKPVDEIPVRGIRPPQSLQGERRTRAIAQQPLLRAIPALHPFGAALRAFNSAPGGFVQAGAVPGLDTLGGIDGKAAVVVPCW